MHIYKSRDHQKNIFISRTHLTSFFNPYTFSTISLLLSFTCGIFILSEFKTLLQFRNSKYIFNVTGLSTHFSLTYYFL